MVDRRFGILTFPVVPFSAVEREWTWAEELGFGHGWVPENISKPQLAAFEQWTLLAALAKTTSRMRIGTLLTTILPRHPVLLAAQVLTVDHASGGRVELGLGVGDSPADHEVLGISQWPAGERLARLEEQIGLLDDLLRGTAVTRAGRYHPVNGARLTAPVQKPRPPLIVGAEGPRALRLAARYADGWATLAGRFGDAKPGEAGLRATDADALAKTRAKVDELERIRVRCGRPAGAIRHVVLAYRQPVDPLSSFDAFDHFVGSYADVGMDEFVFYWPPLANVRDRREIGREQRSVVERIAAARLGTSAGPA